MILFSDRRLKTQIEPLHRTLTDLKNARHQGEISEVGKDTVALLKNLRPVSYYMRSGPRPSVQFGFVAQELEEVLSSMVHSGR